ncbi:MAG TPA: DUF4388 domain-containing protein [Vicinamibacteria bacterium]|jgi:hypothetical protein|nr:DUF4388 domain-containing protein [Vicinamibacteria bacterium]
MAEAFPTSGNIDPKVFPFILMDLHQRGATGSLKVDGPAYPKALYLRGGRILFGSSNDPKDQLGSILIENGKITTEQLEDVNVKVGPGNPLAKVLSESGYVNQRELGEAARIKVERILSDVIAYTSGTFEFEDGVLPKGAVDLKLSTERLLLAAVRRIPDRGFVLRHLESLGVVLKPAEAMNPRLLEIGAETGGLPERLDGQRSLKEAASLTRLDEFEAAKVACGLLFLGLVTRAEDAVEGGAPRAGAGGEGELDLAQTARAAFGDDSQGETPAAPHHAETDAPFFVSEPTSSSPEPALPLPGAEPPAFAASGPAGFPMPEPDPSQFAMVEPGSPAFADSEAPVFAEPAAFAPPAQPASPLTLGVEPEPTPAVTFGSMDSTPSSPGLAESAPGFEIATTSGFASSAPSLAPRAAPDTFEDVTPPPAVTYPDPGPIEDHTSEPVPTSRPSRDDLAALDALLNPSGSGSALGSGEKPKPQERWEPQFRPTSAGRPNRKRSSPALAWVLGGLGVTAAIAGAGFYFFGSQILRVVARARPARTPAPVAAPTASPSVPPERPVTPAPAPTASASAAAPATTAPPPSPPATPAPAPTASPRPSTATADAHSLLQSGSYLEAAQAFASGLKKSGPRFSIQILVACSTETIQKANQSVPGDELYILPVTFKGRSCYRICWGTYPTEEAAAAGLRALPEYFRRGGATPKVVPTAGMLN